MKKDRPWAGADTETYKGKVILLCVIGCSEGHWFRRKYFKRSLHGYIEALLEFAGFNVAFFNLSYDIEALLAMLPAKSRDKFRLDKTQTVSVNGDKYKMSWIPGKEFVLRKDKLIVRCYDMYQYFHKSLDAVSKDLFDEGKIEIPEEWLLNMQKAMDENFDKVVKYCHKDARLVMRIAEHLQMQFAAVKVSFNRPLSCGTLARLHFTLPREVPMRENRLFEKVYYGGRFEILARGTFHDVCYADINSAYPTEIAKLQDISECSFITVDVMPSQENWEWYSDGLAYGMYKVSVYIRPDRNLCPIAQYAPYDPEMPQNALVYFPAGIYTTWVDMHTLQILLEECLITDFHTGFEYRIDKEKKAFPEIRGMYERRKTEPSVSYALKILMNSLYGKLCQKDSRWSRNNILTSQTHMRDGKPYVRKDRFAPFTCLAYASHITGAVRAKIYREAQKRSAFAIMTDAIIFPSNGVLMLRMGDDELGGWKYENLDKVTILGNGWYIYYHKDGRVTSHCRGIRGQVDLEALLKKLGRKKVWETKTRQRVSIAQAAVRPKLRPFVNEILDMPKRLRLNMDTKRCWPADMRAQDFLNRQQFSDPWILVD